MKILVEEDSGYRLWIWYPSMDTEEELIDWWKKTMTSEFVDEFVFYDISGEMDGEWEEITPNDPRHDEE